MTVCKWCFSLALMACMPGLQAEDRVPDATVPIPSTCQTSAKASLPIAPLRDGRFSVVVEVDETPVVMLIDTGASHSLLSPRLADLLGLREDPRRTVLFRGVGGFAQGGHFRIARSLRFGPEELHGYELEISAVVRPGHEADPAAPGGVLGADLLVKYDVELDFPRHVMTLYSVVGCAGRFVPWSGRYQAFQLPSAAEHKLIIPVALNGHGMRALVDTGANDTNVGFEAALAAGVDIAALNKAPTGSSFGAGGAQVTEHRYRFDTFAVGAATFRNAPIAVNDNELSDLDMLLGMDFLRWRKLWVSYATGQVFMQFIPHQSLPVPAPAPAPAPAGAASAPGQALRLWPGMPTNPVAGGASR